MLLQSTPRDTINSVSTITTEIILEVGFFLDSHEIRRGALNGRFLQFQDSPTPLLSSFIKDGVLPPTSSKELAPVVEVNYMHIVQIVINNPFVGPHPFHLHGHHFTVLGRGAKGDGNYNGTRDKLNLKGAFRDTVFVEEHSWAVIKFVADNPGLWLFHCHIDWHNLSGMALLFIVGRERFRNITVIPGEVGRVCGLLQEEQERAGWINFHLMVLGGCSKLRRKRNVKEMTF